MQPATNGHSPAGYSTHSPLTTKTLSNVRHIVHDRSGPVVSTLATATGADNWPTWRGPDANGVAPKTANPPTTWSNTTNIKWKAALTGKGSASPIVGDQVFVVTATKTDRVATAAERPQRNPKLEAKTTAPMNFYKFEVMSFDKNTGKLKWSHIAAEMVPHEGTHPSHSYAAGSPTTDGKRLYVSFGSFGIYAYDLDGKLLEAGSGRMTTRLGWAKRSRRLCTTTPCC